MLIRAYQRRSQASPTFTEDSAVASSEGLALVRAQLLEAGTECASTEVFPHSQANVSGALILHLPHDKASNSRQTPKRPRVEESASNQAQPSNSPHQSKRQRREVPLSSNPTPSLPSGDPTASLQLQNQAPRTSGKQSYQP